MVNADQTVVMIWDAEKKTQHFIRQASFQSEGADVGFLVPTPQMPELAESGNEAFPLLARLTAPKISYVRRPRGGGCSLGCSEATTDSALMSPTNEGVQVLAEKRVAGLDAKVLAATSAESLVEWLNSHGYEFSPEVATWAEPYIRDGWKITALQVAKQEDGQQEREVSAAALRISFQSDRPLFPYREPDPTAAAKQLNVRQRLLRIYFLSDGQYQGELTKEQAWTGRVAWSDKMQALDRNQLLEKLALPRDTGPAEYWLTEFEDYWPYQAAPADLYFSRDPQQAVRHRPPIIHYVSSPPRHDVSLMLLFAAFLGPLWWNRRRRR